MPAPVRFSGIALSGSFFKIRQSTFCRPFLSFFFLQLSFCLHRAMVLWFERKINDSFDGLPGKLFDLKDKYLPAEKEIAENAVAKLSAAV